MDGATSGEGWDSLLRRLRGRKPGTGLEVRVVGKLREAPVLDKPIYDPDNAGSRMWQNGA